MEQTVQRTVAVKKPFNWKLICQLENEAFEEYRQSRLADDFLRKLDQTQYGQMIHGWSEGIDLPHDQWILPSP
jgi:hypothetical protein